MTARVSSAIVSIVLLVLLVFAVRPALGPPNVVRPTGGVMGGPQDDLASLQESGDVLQARTFLQHWRGVAGPAPGAVNEQPVIASPGDATPDPAFEGDE